MVRSGLYAAKFAVVVTAVLAGTAHAEGISNEDCAKIGSALKELADANLGYAKVTKAIAVTQMDFVVKSGGVDSPASALNDEFSAALENTPKLNGKVVGEGVMAFRLLCPDYHF